MNEVHHTLPELSWKREEKWKKISREAKSDNALNSDTRTCVSKSRLPLGGLGMSEEAQRFPRMLRSLATSEQKHRSNDLVCTERFEEMWALGGLA